MSQLVVRGLLFMRIPTGVDISESESVSLVSISTGSSAHVFGLGYELIRINLAGASGVCMGRRLATLHLFLRPLMS